MLGKCSALSPAGNGSARNSQYPQEEQLHTGILTPLSSVCVSLSAIGEELWSFLQGYTEVSEVSAAVCWGKMPLAGITRHSQSVPGVFAGNWREGGTDFILVSNIRSPALLETLSSTPIMGYLNTPVWRRPFPSWNCEGVVIACSST